MSWFWMSSRQRALELAASSAVVSLRPDLRMLMLNGGDPLHYLESSATEAVVHLKAAERGWESVQCEVATLSALCGSLEYSLRGEQTVHTYNDAVQFLNQQIELADHCSDHIELKVELERKCEELRHATIENRRLRGIIADYEEETPEQKVCGGLMGLIRGVIKECCGVSNG